MLASYPLAVRRLRDFAINFLQIPPRDGHPCLDGWFRSLRSMGDLHPLNAYHYSTHQPGLAAPPLCARSSAIVALEHALSSDFPAIVLLFDGCIRRRRQVR